MSAVLDSVTGHYVPITVAGDDIQLYFETAGEGIPLVCLHTAGADGRQYRALLRDPEVTSNFRVLVPDMPWHGKSSPPAGWESREYRLTTDQYLEYILAFMDALDLDQPVVMGCSIGGRVVLHLALRHASKVRAVIGLQSGLHAGNDENRREALDFLHRHDVHGGEVSAGTVAGLIAPQSPDPDRHETLWHYASGGPGVFKGDLYFYFIDGDLRNQALEIDTQECGVHLLSGEYDYSAPPAGAEEIASRIPGATFTCMRHVGHFPMSENPEAFRTYLLPVLDEIRGAL